MEGALGGTPKESVDDELAASINDINPEPSAQDISKKPKKVNRNKRDDKHMEDFMKSINFVQNVEEKFSFVCKKYLECADDNKKLQFYIKQSDKRHVLLQKSKEQLQQELNKNILVKSKLENLCRELQKQNKAIKEESLIKIREEEERRKETQFKFQATLTEITTLLEQNNEKNTKLRDDNINMGEKFKNIMQQHQLREQQVDKISKQMLLESQLSDAKLQKASLEFQAEKERLLADIEQLSVTTVQYKAKILELQSTEAALKGQLSIYTDKYDEFQSALLRSNQVFGGFKEQMEMMSKKIRKLEKESLSWKKRWETSQTALLDMCSDRQASEERSSTSMRQLQQMQNLCRTLQAERTLLLNTLRENNIDCPALPVLPPPPSASLPTAPPPVSATNVDAMVANCAQLRHSLVQLQSQLNDLTNKGDKEEPAKQEKQKSSKSKKTKGAKPAPKNEKDQPMVTRSKCDELIAALEIPSDNKTSPCESEADNVAPNKTDEEARESLIEVINASNMNFVNLN